MSRYTTEVRFICETSYGLEQSKGYTDVDTIVTAVAPKIFNFDFPIFDENYRITLESKILKHFYTREIGAETVGLWKLWLNTKLNEIMPYYNQLYKSELLEFNPLYTHNLTRTHDITGTSEDTTNTSNSSTEKDTGTSTVNTSENNTYDSNEVGSGTDTDVISETDTLEDTKTGSVNTTNTNLNTFSDTPQGTVGNLEDLSYLTNATKDTGTTATTTNDTDNSTTTIAITDTLTKSNTVDKTDTETKSGTVTGSTEDNKTSSATGTSNSNGNTTEHYLESIVGYEGKSASDLLLKYRETFLNIDMSIIRDLEPLFMQLW